MSDKDELPGSNIFGGPRAQPRKEGPIAPDLTDDPGPGRDDRTEVEIEIDQVKERDERE